MFVCLAAVVLCCLARCPSLLLWLYTYGHAYVTQAYGSGEVFVDVCSALSALLRAVALAVVRDEEHPSLSEAPGGGRRGSSIPRAWPLRSR